MPPKKYDPRPNFKQITIKSPPIKTIPQVNNAIPTVNNANLPKIVLPYSSQTVNTSYPINQKLEAPLKATVNNNKENLLKKYPQILLLIPLMIIILSKNK
jgi:hypothetical protein